MKGVDNMLKKDLSAEKRMIVSEKDTARSYGSGDVDVLATPVMIAMMENAAVACLEGILDEGHISVGTGIDIKHMAASPVGVEIVARATICSVDGRLLVFHVEAWDNIEKVGEGRHTRFLVEEARFLFRANSKREK
jgi:predicted thioesterase